MREEEKGLLLKKIKGNVKQLPMSYKNYKYNQL